MDQSWKLQNIVGIAQEVLAEQEMKNIYLTQADWHACGDFGTQFHPHNSTPTLEALCKELSICSKPS